MGGGARLIQASRSGLKKRRFGRLRKDRRIGRKKKGCRISGRIRKEKGSAENTQVCEKERL